MIDPSEFVSSDELDFDELDGIDLIDFEESMSSLDVPLDDELEDIPY